MRLNHSFCLPVTYIRLMQIAECIKSLLHDHSCLCLSQKLLFCDMIEEFTSFAHPIINDVSSFLCRNESFIR